MQNLADRLLHKITSELTNVVRNGDPQHSYPGCINLSFAYVEGKICSVNNLFVTGADLPTLSNDVLARVLNRRVLINGTERRCAVQW
jgi:hypothetical protein